MTQTLSPTQPDTQNTIKCLHRIKGTVNELDDHSTGNGLDGVDRRTFVREERKAA